MLVTGAAQGIGAALARGRVAEGAAVVVADILPGDSIADEIQGQGSQALTVAALRAETAEKQTLCGGKV